MNMKAVGFRRGLERGFTLLELMVVLLILAMLATIAAPQILKHLGKAKSQTAAIQLEALGAALEYYKIDMGRFPTQSQGLGALLSRPEGDQRWDGPYIKKGTSLIDPWGNPYLYKIPGQHGPFDLLSYGADAAEGGEGEDRDIANW